MKLCLGVFTKYMQERHGYDVESETVGGTAGLRKVLYEKMQVVSTAHPDPVAERLSLRDLNNITLNHCKEHYKSKIQAPSTDALVSDRPKRADPVATEHASASIEKDLQALEVARRQHQPYIGGGDNVATVNPNTASTNKLLEPFKENALASSDFEAKMAELKSVRDSVEPDHPPPPQQSSPHHGDNTRLQESISIVNNVMATHHPTNDHPAKDIVEAVISVSPPPSAPVPVPVTARVEDSSRFITNVSNLPKKVVDQFLIVNGSDRDWSLYRDRFRVVADFGGLQGDADLQGKYKNIRSISMKRCIIPQEICDFSSMGHVTKSFFTHNYSFNVPYVLISIDEISDVFDGTNDAIRRSFCQMIVDKHYRSANGRGYFVLVAMQDERKMFHPTPLSRLSRMTIAVRKPNGDIFNESKDDYNVVGIADDPVNPSYLQLQMDKYFDKNEFFKSDTIRIRGYRNNQSRLLEEFVNRFGGHDIMELGQPNQHGYYRTLYIRAPGNFEPSQGKFVTDADAMDALASTTTGPLSGVHVINMSLQCSFSFKLELIAPDVSLELQNEYQPF